MGVMSGVVPSLSWIFGLSPMKKKKKKKKNINGGVSLNPKIWGLAPKPAIWDFLGFSETIFVYPKSRNPKSRCLGHEFRHAGVRRLVQIFRVLALNSASPERFFLCVFCLVGAIFICFLSF